MTRVREALKQAALVDEEIRESSGRAVADGSGGVSPLLPHGSPMPHDFFLIVPSLSRMR